MSGFFGCISQRECTQDVFYGTDYHSHLGTKRGGMAMYDGETIVRSIHSLENAYFRNKFEPDLGKFAGSMAGIGIISDFESQPVAVTSHLGRFAVAMIGRLHNIDELSAELLQKNVNFTEMSGNNINPTELVSTIISSGGTFKEGIEAVQRKVKGSCSMMILTPKGIYASRDKFGRTPIVVGRDDSGYAVATESSSFANLGYRFVRELGPGETVLITAEGMEDVTPPQKRKQICAFQWVYYAYPSSDIEGQNIENVRNRCGEALARRDGDLTDVDIVGGVPDSGIGSAVGYSNCKHIPYKRAFVKYTPTWPRSFMPQDQKLRSLVAKMKLLPNETFTRGASMVLLDDSIVRGTQLKDNVVKLIEAGIKKLHIRISCPPLIFPCIFLNFSTSRSTFDLFTRKVIRDLEQTENFSDETLQKYTDPSTPEYANLVEKMRHSIGCDSLRFQSMEDLVEAIGVPKEDLCTHCWDGSSYVE